MRRILIPVVMLAAAMRSSGWAGASLPSVPGASGPAILSQPTHLWIGVDGGPGSLTGIAWSGAAFAAVGHEAALSSSDSLSWKRARIPPRRDLEAVAWGAGLFVAVGWGTERPGPIILTSPDGENWTERPAPGRGPLWDVAWSGALFLAVGTGSALSSPDGIEWKEAGPPPQGDLRSLASNGRLFVVTGFPAGKDGKPLIATTTDAQWWTERDAPGAGGLENVAWIGDRFLATGRGIRLTSRDGEAWEEKEAPGDDVVTAAAAGGSLLVEVGRGQDLRISKPIVLASQDGSHPAREIFRADGSLMDVAWGANRFVAVGRSFVATHARVLIVTQSPTFALPTRAGGTPVAPPAHGPTAVPGPVSRPPVSAPRHSPVPSGHPVPAPEPPPSPAPSHPVFAPPKPDHCGNSIPFPWEDGHGFRVHSFKRPGHPIYDNTTMVPLEVYGTAVTSDVDPSAANGFCVRGYLTTRDDCTPMRTANGVWDDALDGWRLEMPLPLPPRGDYLSWVELYCCDDQSACAATYGRGARVRTKGAFVDLLK